MDWQRIIEFYLTPSLWFNWLSISIFIVAILEAKICLYFLKRRDLLRKSVENKKVTLTKDTNLPNQ